MPALPALHGRKFSVAGQQDIRSEPARNLRSWWERTAQQHFPTMHDFDIAQHARIAANLFIIEFVDGAYELKLCGEEFVRLIRRKRGVRWSESDEEEISREYAIFMTAVSRNKRPYLGTGNLLLDNRSWILFESITCPLLGMDGKGPGFIGSVCTVAKDKDTDT